jgi:Raf kinase inhibitor-like YbhB/YbcL family protein
MHVTATDLLNKYLSKKQHNQKEDNQMKELTVTSPAFQPNQTIPEKYSCNSQNINPPINIEGIPQGTRSLALILDDPDAPSGTFDHWIAWNISPSQTKIAEHTAPGVEGLNGLGEHGYTGPCPPPGKPHRYTFRVYAVDTELGLGANSHKKDLESALKGHILAEGKLIGLYGI